MGHSAATGRQLGGRMNRGVWYRRRWDLRRSSNARRSERQTRRFFQHESGQWATPTIPIRYRAAWGQSWLYTFRTWRREKAWQELEQREVSVSMTSLLVVQLTLLAVWRQVSSCVTSLHPTGGDRVQHWSLIDVILTLSTHAPIHIYMLTLGELVLSCIL